MEQRLGAAALGLSVLGWLCLAILMVTRPPRPRDDGVSHETVAPLAPSLGTPFLVLALALPLGIWLLTLPNAPPFSSGQGWGRGFLLGGLMAAVSAFLASSATRKRTVSARQAVTLSSFGAVIVCCIPLLWMRQAVVEALLGAGLGWVAVSLVLLFGVDHSATTEEKETPFSTPLLYGAVNAVALLAVATLGVYRDFLFASVPRGTYSAIAVAFAAGIAIVALIGILAQDILTKARPASAAPSQVPSLSFVGAAVGLVVPLVLGYFLAIKLLDDLALFYVIALGLILGIALWALIRSERSEGISNQGDPPLSAICVSLCAVMLAYQLMQGYGIGMMLLAMLPVVLLCFPSATDGQGVRERERALAHGLTLIGSFVAIIVVSRIFATRFRADLRGVGLEDQFAMFGFLAGATVPALLCSLWFKKRNLATTVAASISGLFLVGVLSLVVLAAMLTLWGVKVVPAFFFGLALAAAVFHPTAASRAQTAAISLLTLALSVTLAQWTQHFLPLANASRVARLNFLFWAVGGAIVVVLLVDYGSRWMGWMRRRKLTATGGKL